MAKKLFGGTMEVSSGSFPSAFKWDARSGRASVAEKDTLGNTHHRDVTREKFAINYLRAMVGPTGFGPRGPLRDLMVPLGQLVQPAPDDRDAQGKPVYRSGIAIQVAGKALGGVCELITNTLVTIGALDELYNVYAQAPEAAAGKLPVVSIIDAAPVTSGTGHQRATYYKPVFRIEAWIDYDPQLWGEKLVPHPKPDGSVAVAAPTPAAAPRAAPSASAQLVDNDLPF